MMRLLLLFAFVFIVIIQITCNSNQCGKQAEIIGCADIKGQATFIHVDKEEFITNLMMLFYLYLVLGNFIWSSNVPTCS